VVQAYITRNVLLKKRFSGLCRDFLKGFYEVPADTEVKIGSHIIGMHDCILRVRCPRIFDPSVQSQLALLNCNIKTVNNFVRYLYGGENPSLPTIAPEYFKEAWDTSCVEEFLVRRFYVA